MMSSSVTTSQQPDSSGESGATGGIRLSRDLLIADVATAAATSLQTIETAPASPVWPPGAAVPRCPGGFLNRCLDEARTVADGLVRGYAEILFLDGRISGLLVMAVTMAHPRVGLGGLISALAACLFAYFVRMDRQFLSSGFYTYNSVLVGLGLGAMLGWSWHSVAFIAAAGVLTLVVSTALAGVLNQYLRLPVLSLPFVICISIAWLAAERYSNLLVALPYDSVLLAWQPNLPEPVLGFFRALSAVLFVPSVAGGLVLCLLLVRHSRILVLMGMAGYATGLAVRSAMLGSMAQAVADTSNFNFILIGMAVGSVFLVPSLSSYLVALLAVAVSTLVLDAATIFGSLYGVPAYALPFNTVVLAFVYTLGLIGFHRLPGIPGRTPEDTLEMALARQWRFPGHARTLRLPFFGRWTVWQGFDDRWTHRGAWRYAYDFVITDDDGGTCSGPGTVLADYYCFGKPVLSPIRGRVVKVVNDLPDNPIGQVDTQHNWGNLAVLYDERGFYVELSHFAQESIRVQVGDWVEPGTLLGLCGNSGYSPQPHLHVQVQSSDRLGAGTLPFAFAGYVENGRYHSSHLPSNGARVEPVVADRNLEAATNFVLDEELTYNLVRHGQVFGRVRWTVRMAPDGTFYFDAGRGARLYFGKHEGTFYCYRLEGRDTALALLHLALPRLPLGVADSLHWSDELPAGLALNGWRRALAQLASSVAPSLGKLTSNHRFEGRQRVESRIASRLLGIDLVATVQLDAQGIAAIRYGDNELRRVDDKQPIT